MMEIILNSIQVFVLIYCVLYLIQRLFNFIKVLRLKEGKVESTLMSSILTKASIAYILTYLIL